MSQSVPHRLGQVLLSQGKINQGQLDEALAQQKNSHQAIGEALISLGYLTPEDLKGALKKQVSLRTAAFYLAAAMAPLSMNCVAEEIVYQDEHQPTYVTERYQHLNDTATNQEWLSTAAKAIWNLYQISDNVQTDSNLTYSIDRNVEMGGYQIQLNYRY